MAHNHISRRDFIQSVGTGGTALSLIALMNACQPILGKPSIQANKKARYNKQIDRAILDIEFESLTNEPIDTIKRIYQFFDVPWSNVYEKCLEEFLMSQKKRKQNRHNYDPDQFGQVWQELNTFFDTRVFDFLYLNEEYFRV